MEPADLSVPLREYVERRLADLEQRTDLRFESTALATRKTEDATALRFSQTNEWRATVGDVLNRAMTREQAEVQLAALRDRMDQALGTVEARIRALEEFRANIEGRIAVIALLVTVLNIILTAGATLLLRARP